MPVGRGGKLSVPPCAQQQHGCCLRRGSTWCAMGVGGETTGYRQTMWQTRGDLSHISPVCGGGGGCQEDAEDGGRLAITPARLPPLVWVPAQHEAACQFSRTSNVPFPGILSQDSPVGILILMTRRWYASTVKYRGPSYGAEALDRAGGLRQPSACSWSYDATECVGRPAQQRSTQSNRRNTYVNSSVNPELFGSKCSATHVPALPRVPPHSDPAAAAAAATVAPARVRGAGTW